MAFFAVPPKLIVGAAGRLSVEKGFEVLVDAARLINSKYPHVGFVVFGEGAQRERLQQRIDRYHLGGSFVLAGFRHDLDELIRQLDLFVLPSYTEGLPNVVLEAFAAGVPVVATSVGGTPEIVQHERSGLLVPPGDASALAEAIADLVSSEYRRRLMGAAGRDAVTEHFDFQSQASSYQELFTQVLQEIG